MITTIIQIHIIYILLRHLKSLKKALQTARKFRAQIKLYRGQNGIQKLIKVGRKYYWDMYGAAWPSAGFVRNVKRECNRVNASGVAHVGMRNVLFAITTKCPLQCEHCFEWNNLNKPERLSLSDLHLSIDKLIAYGAGQIHLSGGEPMMRYDDIISLLKTYHHKVGFWIYTSGYGVSPGKAKALKKAGLTGMSISLDHFDEGWHNKFRHYKNAFNIAQEAVDACREAGLVTTLTICVTKEFISRQNLETYLQMAKSLGVSFVQILEPKAVGHYEGKPVHLSTDEKKVLSDFYLETISNPQYQDFPGVMYHEHYKESLGCRGAGNGAFYIDPLGGVHACPFCRHSVGNLVTDSIEDCVNRLWSNGCGVTELPKIKERVAPVFATS